MSSWQQLQQDAGTLQDDAAPAAAAPGDNEQAPQVPIQAHGVGNNLVVVGAGPSHERRNRRLSRNESIKHNRRSPSPLADCTENVERLPPPSSCDVEQPSGGFSRQFSIVRSISQFAPRQTRSSACGCRTRQSAVASALCRPTAKRQGGAARPTSCGDPTGPQWCAGGDSLVERNGAMLFNQCMADVHFVLTNTPDGCEERVPAHSYVLSIGSSVFYAMFHGGMKQLPGSEIRLPDVEPDALKALLRYLYTDEIQLDEGDTATLACLYAAKKYMVARLARVCLRRLHAATHTKNVCALLAHPLLSDETELMSRCWQVLDVCCYAAVTSPGFLNVGIDTLQTILRRDTLNINEAELFLAASKWAEHQCVGNGISIPTGMDIRRALGPALGLIRMAAMTPQKFADVVVPSQVLTAEETNDVFVRLCGTRHRQRAEPEAAAPLETELPPASATRFRFGSKPRTGQMLHTVARFMSCAYRSNQWRYRGRCDAIQFSTDRRIFVAGVGLYGSSAKPAQYTLSLKLYRHDRLCSCGDESCLEDGGCVPPPVAPVSSGGTTAPAASGGSAARQQDSGGAAGGLSQNRTLVAVRNTTLHTPGTSATLRVDLDTPVQMDAYVPHTLCCVLEGGELSYFGQEGLLEAHHSDAKVTFRFECSEMSTNGTGVHGGQIPEILFYGGCEV